MQGLSESTTHFVHNVVTLVNQPKVNQFVWSSVYQIVSVPVLPANVNKSFAITIMFCRLPKMHYFSVQRISKARYFCLSRWACKTNISPVSRFQLIGFMDFVTSPFCRHGSFSQFSFNFPQHFQGWEKNPDSLGDLSSAMQYFDIHNFEYFQAFSAAFCKIVPLQLSKKPKNKQISLTVNLFDFT